MGRLIFAAITSIDGYTVDASGSFDWAAPDPEVHAFVNDLERGIGTYLYGRRMYEIMRYWDEDQAEWDAPEREYAAAWQSKPKWVVSRTLKSVGPNASLIEGDLAAAIRGLKAQHEGEIEVAGPELAHSLTELGLVDEYRLYLHPVVLGHGKPFFAGPRPPLRLAASDRIGEKVIRLTYVPA